MGVYLDSFKDGADAATIIAHLEDETDKLKAQILNDKEISSSIIREAQAEISELRLKIGKIKRYKDKRIIE